MGRTLRYVLGLVDTALTSHEKGHENLTVAVNPDWTASAGATRACGGEVQNLQ